MTQQSQPTPQPATEEIMHSEPFRASTNIALPVGWKIADFAKQQVQHGPYPLANGKGLSFSNQAYQLEPNYEAGALHRRAGVFDGEPERGSAREDTGGCTNQGDGSAAIE
jgi:hypothetical protein